MNNKQGGVIKVIVVGVILVALVAGYYYYLTNMRKPKGVDETETASAVEEVLLRNLDKNYPPSAKEVVKYYGEITKCFYKDRQSTRLNSSHITISNAFTMRNIPRKNLRSWHCRSSGFMTMN